MYIWVYHSSVVSLFFLLSQGRQKMLQSFLVSLTCISVGRFESSREHSQMWNSIIYWGRLPDFLTLFWDRKLSVFQGMPGHDSTFTVFFLKSSVAMVSYKRGCSKMCVAWSMFKKCVTTVNGHQQTKQIISHQHHNIWMPLWSTYFWSYLNYELTTFCSTELYETFLKLLAYCYSF